MCGFAAIIPRNGAPLDVEALTAMSAALSHRGPDGDGACEVGGVGLAHRRLAIIDPAGGAQPITRQGVTVVYNGALYNDAEVRATLTRAGHGFQTTCDTETLAVGLAHAWAGLLPTLNGMFSFVAVDPARRRLLAARDHAGIKPLYWTQTSTAILIASEIKALLAHPDVACGRDDEALADYLTFQYVLGDATLFRGIRRLRPGHWLQVELERGEVQVGRWWHPTWQPDLQRREADAVEELRTLLADAVQRQLRADVPLGTYLSGGLDSSLVTMLAAQAGGAPRPAFTGAFDEGPSFDERPYARTVADAAPASLREVVITPEMLVRELPGLMYLMDEPVAGPGVLPQLLVARAASREVKVVLGGQGGDELFGGYARYLVAYLEQALKGAIFGTNEEGEHVVSLASLIGHLPHLQSYGPMLQRFWRQGLFDDMDRRYFALIDRSEAAFSILTRDARAHYDGEAVYARFQQAFRASDTQSYLARMMHFDLSESLPALLHVEDRVSMSVGLESRVPLLDPRLVTFIMGLPPRVIFGSGEPKHLLRLAAAGTLPAPVLARRDKMGFPVPLHRWRTGIVGDFKRDVLLSSHSATRGLFDRDALRKHLTADEPFDRQLWGALCLELWCRTWLDIQHHIPPSADAVARLRARLGRPNSLTPH